MGKRRRQPTDPETIALRRAQLAADERTRQRDPGNWGLPELDLQTSDDVRFWRGQAKRMDAFDSLRAGGGLDHDQYTAACKLVGKWAEMLGVGGAAGWTALGKIDRSGTPLPASQRQVSAMKSIHETLKQVGPADARLLRALVEPIVMMRATAVGWRDLVRLVTGETHSHAQGCAVRRACENLRQVYGIGSQGQAEREHPFHLYIQPQAAA